MTTLQDLFAWAGSGGLWEQNSPPNNMAGFVSRKRCCLWVQFVIFFSVSLRFSLLCGNDQSPNSNSTCNVSTFFKRIFRVSKCFVGIQTIFTFRFAQSIAKCFATLCNERYYSLCHLGNKCLRIFVKNRLKQLCKMA